MAVSEEVADYQDDRMKYPVTSTWGVIVAVVDELYVYLRRSRVLTAKYCAEPLQRVLACDTRAQEDTHFDFLQCCQVLTNQLAKNPQEAHKTYESHLALGNRGEKLHSANILTRCCSLLAHFPEQDMAALHRTQI
ncbi:hypothetical protein MTO96_035206 [Rhipicephalus appendiculatus]